MNIKGTAIIVISLLPVLMSGCGGPKQTSGFFVGFGDTGTTETVVHEEETEILPEAIEQPEDAETVTEQETAVVTPVQVSVENTLVNCTFGSVLDSPFGDNCSYRIYNDALHIDNSAGNEPVVLLSTAGLLDDGLIEAQFDLQEAPFNSVVGVVISSGSTDRFILLGVNSRGQFTVQKMMSGYWVPLMGMDPFETSRLLPYSPGSVLISVFVHGSYVDFSVNGQLLTVIKTALPALGQAGVFVDSQINADLSRFTVIPAD